jgi:hypothetical protein
MAEYNNENRGVAFKNDYKKDERHPDFKGKGNFNGQDFEFAFWEKYNDKGQYFSFSFSEPYVKPEAAQPTQSGYEKFKQSKPQPKVDVPLEDIGDAPIDLSEIPF